MFNNNYNNPYYGQPQGFYQSSVQRPYMQQNETQNVMPTQFIKSGLQGKQVDSIEVVKASEVPFDGSTSYFPLTDGSAIITKQLQNDGTSKLVVFKPIEEQNEEKRYITQDDLKSALNGLNLDEIEDLKEEIKDLKKEFKEFKKK